MRIGIKSFFFAAIALSLAGCNTVDWGIRKENPVEEGVWRDYYRTKRFSEDAFMLEVIRFKDARLPREKMPDVSQNVIYEYRPEELLSGVNYRLPVLFDKHFNVGRQQEPAYRVELDLLKIRTIIRTGNIRVGPLGRYDVETEFDVVVRRPDSSILFKDIIAVHLDRSRKSMKGRDPAADLDRQRMYDLTEAAVQKTAQKIIWGVRQAHKIDIRNQKLKEMKELEEKLGIEKTY
ncbi:MAG: hypothetical protein OXR68_02230 [Alphaproteobacteria bacterium]|nr:hypothetical protein [Alphaproteobacteria bacterium]MDD9919428.1 hypothetical protein [Alphaproteobacteria bacterium]